MTYFVHSDMNILLKEVNGIHLLSKDHGQTWKSLDDIDENDKLSMSEILKMLVTGKSFKTLEEAKYELIR